MGSGPVSRCLPAVLLAVSLALLLTSCNNGNGGSDSAKSPEASGVTDDVGSVNADGADPSLRQVPGRWRKMKARGEAPELTPEQQASIKQLESIGYLVGSRVSESDETLTVFDRDRAWPGINLYTSGHMPGAVLMDMEGNVLHTWEKAITEVWAGTDVPDLRRVKDYWRRVYLYPNGDLLAIFEGVGLFKLDKDSNLLWEARNGAHHDLEVLPNGDILVLTRAGRMIPRLHATEPILEDFIVRVDANGKELHRVSMIEALENSEFAKVLADGALGSGDILHTNTLSILDGRFASRAPWLAAGYALVCMRDIHGVAVVDLEAGRVAHAFFGAFRYQHDAKILPNGNMMLFDNQGARDHKSRVVEFDPVRSSLAWSYAGTPGSPLDSPTLGAAERLPNGNTLITESDGGRALEVTSGGEIVWEFFNPYRVGEGGELIATIFELVRLPEDFPVGWARN